ncbi:MAG: TfoX/Sxy family DNA transformation protein [Candidatus Bipolaricaulota bacterium]|nr:TfoX/Sxy family DNA transformation protein [Candidatus Bipolaricaulota bacterium]
MPVRGSDDSLELLTNIGTECAKALRAAGVATAEDMRRLGSVEAAVRIRKALGADAVCRSRLSALEGAVRGVRWHAIPKSERDRLWEELERRSQGGGR